MKFSNPTPEIKLEEIKITFDHKILPNWLPQSVINKVNEECEDLRNRASYLQKMREKDFRRATLYWIPSYKEAVDRFHFTTKLLFDCRMKGVWGKLYKINPEETNELFSFISGYTLAKRETPIEDHGHNPKISAVRLNLRLCEELIEKFQKNEGMYSSFNPSAPKSNSRLWLHGDVTDAFYSGLEVYIKGLKKIINHYEKHRGVFDRLDYINSPFSRKRLIKNSEAIYLARVTKLHFLKNYQRPLNKEIGEILSVLFGDTSDVGFDSDYVAKVTKEADKTYKTAQKMEDSPDIYEFKQSF